MATRDKTKELLEQMLAELYSEQAQSIKSDNGSYLIAQNGQLLGKITDNSYDNDSILNEYGPYGSSYSMTSIFNQYSDYGSKYGQNSINNPYCNQPPKLIIKGQLIGYITKNIYTQNAISPKAFLHTLKNDFNSLLSGKITGSETAMREDNRESFIEAHNKTFLGKLNPNQFDVESIFNKFGDYGNQFSQSSIFNKFGDYGSQFSELSPYNKFSNTPPRIYLNGKFHAYLTVNQLLNPRVDPDKIFEWAERNANSY